VLSPYNVPLAALDSPLGERLYNAFASIASPLIGLPINATIALTSTSETSSVGNDVVIAEQVEYTIQVTFPEGTIPSFSVVDLLPQGLALVSLSSVSFGSSISNTAQPTFSPTIGSLPRTTGGLVQWSFTSPLVVGASSSAADRQITIKFVAQVENTATVSSGVTLSTNASLVFNGVTSDIPVLGSGGNTNVITLDVTEPTLAVGLIQVTPVQPVQAGDLIRYQIRIDDVASPSLVYQAFDINLNALISSKMIFKSGSTRMSQGGTSYNAATSVAVNDPDVVISGGPSNNLAWGRSQTSYNPVTSPFASVSSTSQPVFLIFDLQVDISAEPELPITQPQVNLTWTPLRASNFLSTPLAPLETLLGERVYSDFATLSTPLPMRPIQATIRITNTTEPTSTGINVVVGEQIEYTIVMTLPGGTAMNINVSTVLPDGLFVVKVPSITSDSGITMSSPTFATDGINTNWILTNVSVLPNGLLGRNITIKLVAQVQNKNTVFSGVTLTPTPTFSYLSVVHPINTLVVNGVGITVQVGEPVLSQQLIPSLLFVTTGTTFTMQLIVTNTGSFTAYMVDFWLTTEPRLSYINGTSRFNGVALSDPKVNGSQLYWNNKGFVIALAPGASFTLSFNLTTAFILDTTVSLPITDVLQWTSIDLNTFFTLYNTPLNPVGNLMGPRLYTSNGLVSITGSHSPLICQDDYAITDVNTPVDLKILGNDFSLDPDPSRRALNISSIKILIPTSFGNVSVDYNTGIVTYMPGYNYTGTDSFVYQVCDFAFPIPNCENATGYIIVNGFVRAYDDYGKTPMNHPLDINVIANDYDFEKRKLLTLTLTVTLLTSTLKNNIENTEINISSFVILTPPKHGVYYYNYMNGTGVFVPTTSEYSQDVKRRSLLLNSVFRLHWQRFFRVSHMRLGFSTLVCQRHLLHLRLSTTASIPRLRIHASGCPNHNEPAHKRQVH